jgi:SmpA/OmlA family protein
MNCTVRLFTHREAKSMKSIIAIIAAAMLAGCAANPMWASPLMSDERFAPIEAGMTRDDVRRIAGPPLKTMAYPLLGTDSWEYQGYDTWGYFMEYSVTFASDGRVVSKLARRVNVGGRGAS